MFTTMAKVRVADMQRFIDVFATHGLQARRSHGSQAAQAFACPQEPGMALVVIDWADQASFDGFRADPAVRETMKSGGALEPPVFTLLERLGSFDG
jgi:quinol monooxygenase YgiN